MSIPGASFAENDPLVLENIAEHCKEEAEYFKNAGALQISVEFEGISEYFEDISAQIRDRRTWTRAYKCQPTP